MPRAKQVVYNERTGALQGTLLTNDVCRQLDFIRNVSDENGVVSDLKHVIYDLEEDEIDSILSMHTGDCIEDKTLGTLSNIQTTGVAFMYFSKGVLLGDSVGLGKTVEVAGTMNLLTEEFANRNKDFRYMVLTDKDVVPQFQRELIRFTGEYVDVLNGDKKSCTNFLSQYPDYTLPNIVGPSSLFNQPLFQEYLLSSKEEGYRYPFDCLIVDESSVLANGKRDNKTYAAGKLIRDNVDYCYLLNATAFESKLSAMYYQLNFVDPTLLPTKTAFEKRYCVMQKSIYGNAIKPSGKYKNSDEFMSLARYRYLKRTRKGTGAVMEGCTSHFILLPESDEQHRLMATTSYPTMLFDNPSYFDRNIPFTEYTSPKAGGLIRLLNGEIDIEGGWEDARTVLVYCYHKECQWELKRLLGQYGISSEVLNGDTPRPEREKYISQFKRGEFRVLITNVMKGLNFGGTNHIAIYSTPGNVDHLVQFEGRSTRTMNIIDKHLVVFCLEGKEKARFDNVIRNRAIASDAFAGSDHSLVLSLLFAVKNTN